MLLGSRCILKNQQSIYEALKEMKNKKASCPFLYVNIKGRQKILFFYYYLQKSDLKHQRYVKISKTIKSGYKAT